MIFPAEPPPKKWIGKKSCGADLAVFWSISSKAASVLVVRAVMEASVRELGVQYLFFTNYIAQFKQKASENELNHYQKFTKQDLPVI